MSNEEILDLFKDYDFCNFYDTGEMEIDAPFDYDYASGITKAVIMPYDESFVIKLPFKGSYEDLYDENDEIVDTFVEFNVPNLSESSHSTDYCARELYLYHKAKQAKVSEVLIKNTYIGTINDEPVYIQPRVTTFHGYYADVFDDNDIDESAVHTKDEINSMIKSCEKSRYTYYSCNRLFNMWLVDVRNYYGEKRFVNILNFIEDYLDDLHTENIGYLGDKPIILDYAGFYD